MLSFFRGMGLAAALALGGAKACEAAEQYWQLTFIYGEEGLGLVRAEPMAPTVKSVRVPGLAGAVLQLGYELQWLDATGAVLLRSPVRIPLGRRVPLTLEAGSGTCLETIPDEGAFVLRTPAPDAPGRVRTVKLVRDAAAALAAAGAAPVRVPPAFGADEHSFLLPEPPVELAGAGAAVGPFAASKVRDNGPDNNRLVIVLMGDGYTEASLESGAFSNQVSRFLTHLFNTSPWNEYRPAVNVYRVDIRSRESGADYEDASPDEGGTQKDTFLNAGFWNGGTERCLYLRAGGATRAFAAADAFVGAGVWDEVLVFVNSTKYGGCGGSVGVSSIHVSADEIQVHEFGHSFGNLADEYESTSSNTNCTPSSTRNVDCGQSFPSVKWDVWVDPGTPIPTPETSTYGNVVGAFEGASDRDRGIYRPKLNCKMRSLGVAFCPVCKEGHILKLFQEVRLADSASPPFGFAELPTNSARVFTVTDVDLAGLSYRWLLNGLELAGQTSSSVTISSDQVTEPNMDLRVLINHSTPLVRAEAIEQSFAWQLNVVTMPSFHVANVTVPEGTGASAQALFDVILSYPVDQPVTLGYATADGTARAGLDYLPRSGVLLFPANQTTQTVAVTVMGDALPEPHEVFFLNLLAATNATIVDRQAVGMILDEDNPPVVNLIGPTNGAVYSQGPPITLQAEAADADGRVALVEFFQGTTLVGASTFPPYEANWTNASPGSHILTAVVSDRSGLMATSAPVRVIVLPAASERFELVAIDQPWKYDASTTSFGSAWKDPAFDDSGWAGPAPALFYNESGSLPAPKNTLVPLTTPGGSRIRGFYYRTHFNFPITPPPGLILVSSNLVDDGAVFYLNGVELGRLRMPSGTVTRTTLASSTPPGGDASVFEELLFPGANLVEGTNLLAVEVHQQSDSSSDTVFGMQLAAVSGFAPVVTDLLEPADRVVEQGRATTLAVSAVGSEPVSYQWIKDGSPIAGASGPSYAIGRMTADGAGAYLCRVSNAVGVAESRIALVGYQADETGPTLLSALRGLDPTVLTLVFSERLGLLETIAVDNYRVTTADGGPDLVITRANPSNGTNVVLYTSQPEGGRDYLVIVNGLRDFLGNLIAPDSQVPVGYEILLVVGDRQPWRYFQSDTDPGPGWAAPGFDDSVRPWADGQALFDAKRPPGRTTVGPANVPVRTMLNLTNPPAASDVTIAYYFRTHFEFQGPAAGTHLFLRALADDGAAFYLNGVEVRRLGLPPAPSPLAYNTLAERTQGDSENVFEGPFEVPANSLVEGDNVLAAELHQANLGSSDVSFSAELSAVVPGFIAPPALLVELIGGHVVVNWTPATAVLQEADQVTGPWRDVQPPVASPYQVPAPSAQKFYRARRP